jgi:hypothetical protein
MRKACTLIMGTIAALAVLATPVLARTADAQKTDDKTTSPPACRSYEQTPEGEWKPIPCAEVGTEARTPRKPAAGNADATTH